VKEYIGANIYHAHDYHTALAPAYMKPDTVVALTIHNAGPSYQGLYWTKDFGGSRIPHPDYPNGIPSGDLASHEKLLDILGVDLDTHLKYFEHNDNGDFAFINGARFIGENNLIEGMPVSSGYADELMMSQEEVVEKIRLEKGVQPKNLEKIYIPNGGVKFSVLDGIENGLDEKYRAATHPALAKHSPEELVSKLSDSITNPEVRQEWLNDLHFGQHLDTASGIAEVHQKKALLKSMLQKETGLEINPDKPLFVLVSRISSQKHISVLALNIKHIIDQGGQVIVGGKISDPKDIMGVRTARILKHLENDPDLKGQMKYLDTYVDRDLGALIMSGGDFFPMTSKFEPCGLADIEAAWLGTIPVTRKTGGLGKITHSFTYEWADTTDEKGEVLAFRKTLDEVIKFYKEFPDRFKQMRIDAMKENFSWKVALSRYYENYRTAALYKIIKELNEQTKTNEITLEQAQKIVDIIFEKLPDDLIRNFKRVLLKKQDKTPLEKLIISEKPATEATLVNLRRKSISSFSASSLFCPPGISYRTALR
jgi:glycogen synthase